jgi:ribosome maturation factor RimP
VTTDDVQLRTLLDEVVTGAGLVLEDVRSSTVGRRRLVRVVVDLPDDEIGAVDLDRVAAVSREVGDALDATDALGEAAYALEVTTPGVDRPLTERRHWLRARTRLVRAERDGGEPVTGRLVEVTEAGPVLLVAGTKGEEQVALAWAEVRRGVVEVEFRKKDEPAADLDEDDAGILGGDDPDGSDDSDDLDDADELDELDEDEEA